MRSLEGSGPAAFCCRCCSLSLDVCCHCCCCFVITYPNSPPVAAADASGADFVLAASDTSSCAKTASPRTASPSARPSSPSRTPRLQSKPGDNPPPSPPPRPLLQTGQRQQPTRRQWNPPPAKKPGDVLDRPLPSPGKWRFRFWTACRGARLRGKTGRGFLQHRGTFRRG